MNVIFLLAGILEATLWPIEPQPPTDHASGPLPAGIISIASASTNRPPTISPIPNQIIVPGGSTGTIPFIISDPDTPDASQLILAATSSNPALVPIANIVFGGKGSARTVTVSARPNAQGKVTVQIIVADPLGATATTSFTVTIGAPSVPPQISTPPQSQTVTVGTSATFSVQATGTPPLLYQWNFGNSAIPGATSSIFTIAAVSLTNAGLYSVTVLNAAGSTTSAPATLTVLPPPTQPPTISSIADISIPADRSTGPIPFTVDHPFPQDLTNLVVIPSSSNETLVPKGSIVVSGTGAARAVTVTPVTGQSGTTVITLTVVDPAGVSASTSFLLTVQPTIVVPQVLVQPAAQTVVAGSALTLSVKASGTPPLSYQWNLGSKAIPGATASDFTIPAAAAADAGTYTVTVSNAAGSITSSPATLTVVPPPNHPPTIAVIADVSLPQDSSTQPIPFTIADPDPQDANGLSLSPSSSDEGLIPKENIVFGGKGTSRTVTITPVAGKSGGATVTVTVADPTGATASSTFVVTVLAVAYDYGDAPLPYPTSGPTAARHVIVPGFYLGTTVDAEPDGQPSPTAQGDDLSGSVNDEDGVTIPPLTQGRTAQVTVVASRAGLLDAWFDFDQDGKWDNATEVIFRSVALSAGPNILPFLVPADARIGSTFARFRLSSQGGLSPEGTAPDGEVEDYQVTIHPPEICQQSTQSDDFWLTFPGNYAPDPANPIQLTLRIVGSGDTRGQVEIPALGLTANFQIPPGDLATTVLVTNLAELGDLNDGVAPKGVHVTASSPVTVFGLNKVQYTSDGFTALPTVSLGTEYIVQAYGNVQSTIPELNGSQFAIVGVLTNTTVTIVPSAGVGVRTAHTPFTIHLERGLAYQLRCTNDAPGDLSGTIISADKPIAVFGGHRCANVGSADSLYCDYLVEQLLPVQSWGTEFLSAPLVTRVNGDTFRFLAAEDTTQVTVDAGEGVPQVRTLNRGESWETILARPAVITSDKHIFVTQYANSSDYDQVEQADPFMLTVPSKRMYLNHYAFSTGGDGFSQSFAQMVAPAETPRAISLDGHPIPAEAYTAIGTGGAWSASVPVEPGAHTISGAASFGLAVYGFAEYESYAWPGGLQLNEAVPPEVECPSELTITVDLAKGSCRAIIPDLRGQVHVTDNCGLPDPVVITQHPGPGTQVSTGDHFVTFTTSDLAGNIGSCTSQLHVLDPRPLVVTCPTNLTVTCTDPDGAIVRYFPSAQNPCGEELPVRCVPDSRTLFRPGTTPVNCTLGTGTNALACSFDVTVVCPSLAISISSQSITISWSGAGNLETANQATGPWTQVLGAKPPFVFSANSQLAFYRLRL